MIVLKILLTAILVILGIVLGILLLVLILPVQADVSFIDEKFKYKVGFSYVPLLSSEGWSLWGWLKKRRKKPKKPKKPKPAKEKKRKNTKNSEKKKNPAEDLFEEELEAQLSAEEDFEAEKADISDIQAADSPDSMKDDKAEKEKKQDRKKANQEEFSDDFEEFSDYDDEEEDDEPRKTLGEKVEFVLDIWENAGRPLGKLFKGFHFKEVFIDFIVADEDAYKCAVNYGRISAILYNVLAWFCEVFTVGFRTVDVQAGFSIKKSRWDASFKMTFRLMTVVIAGLWFLITYLFKIYIPNKIKKRKAEKSAAEQK